MRWLKRIGWAVAAVVVLAACARLIWTDPIGPLAGGRLSGSEAPFPADWDFSDAHFTIAVETRPEDPHSVTTICFVHEGTLIVPAQGGSDKAWTHYVLDDPRVRIKVGERVFPARATRILEPDPEDYFASAARKYKRMADRPGADRPEDICLFRIEPREG